MKIVKASETPSTDEEEMTHGKHSADACIYKGCLLSKHNWPVAGSVCIPAACSGLHARMTSEQLVTNALVTSGHVTSDQ